MATSRGRLGIPAQPNTDPRREPNRIPVCRIGSISESNVRVAQLLLLLQADDALGQNSERRPVSLEIGRVFRLPAISVEQYTFRSKVGECFQIAANLIGCSVARKAGGFFEGRVGQCKWIRGHSAGIGAPSASAIFRRAGQPSFASQSMRNRMGCQALP